MEYTFDPERIKIRDAREYRALNGTTVWASIDTIGSKGPNGLTEDEVLGLAFIIRKQNVPNPESFTLADMDDWDLGQCIELIGALGSSLARPQTGSETSS